jgi:hypothetical protein
MKIENFEDCKSASELSKGLFSPWVVAHFCLFNGKDNDDWEIECILNIEAEKELSERSTLAQKVELYNSFYQPTTINRTYHSKVEGAINRQCEQVLRGNLSIKSLWKLANQVRGIVDPKIYYRILNRIFFNTKSHRDRIRVIKSCPSGFRVQLEYVESALRRAKTQDQRWELVKIAGAYGIVYTILKKIRENSLADLELAMDKESVWNVFKTAPRQTEESSLAFKKFISLL